MAFVAVSTTANPSAGPLRVRWVTDAAGRLVMSWTTDTTTEPRPLPAPGSPDDPPAALAA